LYTVIEEKDCTCFRCQNLRANQTFKSTVEEKTKHMGFVPRLYDMSRGFNKIPPQYAATDQIPKSVLANVLHNLEVMIEKNKALTFQKGKHPIYCIDCGRLHIRNPKHQYGADWVCNSCFEARYRFCTHCNKMERSENMVNVRETIHGAAHSVCKTCYHKFYIKCQRCNGVYAAGIYQTIELGNGVHVMCPACVLRIKECAECGMKDFQENLHQVDADRFICHMCMEEQLPIKDYNYKPMPYFQLDKTQEGAASLGGEYMGLEWEIENCGEYNNEMGVKRLVEIFGKRYIYCKKDSSISHGFEVVTHPFSYPNFVARRKDWVAAMNTMTELGYRNKSANPDWKKTVGIHVHINKKAFTTTHLYKFMKFFYNPENRGFLIDISQRGKENYYAKFHPDAMKNLCLSSKRRQNICKVQDPNDQHVGEVDKNVAVNLKPTPTVEVRIFASTLDPRDFFKNIEFTRAVFWFSKDIPISEVTVPKFLAYCMGREAKTYKNLYTFLCEAMTGHLVAHNIKPMYDFSGKGVV
jgi:hypothetical protein